MINDLEDIAGRVDHRVETDEIAELARRFDAQPFHLSDCGATWIIGAGVEMALHLEQFRLLASSVRRRRDDGEQPRTLLPPLAVERRPGKTRRPTRSYSLSRVHGSLSATSRSAPAISSSEPGGADGRASPARTASPSAEWRFGRTTRISHSQSASVCSESSRTTFMMSHRHHPRRV